MRRLAALAALAAGLTHAADHRVQVEAPEEWQALLGSLGLEATAEPAQFRIVVAGFASTDGPILVN